MQREVVSSKVDRNTEMAIVLRVSGCFVLEVRNAAMFRKGRSQQDTQNRKKERKKERMNDNKICVRSPAHELLESARKKVRRTERDGGGEGNHMRVRSPAHELLKSARKLEVRAILGTWQQFWCLKLSELCFFDPAF